MIKKRLKLAHIGWSQSIHLQRFAKWFAERGHDVHVFSNTECRIPAVIVHNIHIPPKRVINKRFFRLCFNYTWISYIRMFLRLNRFIQKLKPDILHVHTLYLPAQLGLFINYTPLVIMPWNGDILWKGKRSILHKYLVKRALRRADAIPLQLNYLKKRCIDLGANEKKIEIIQFGVDVNKFKRVKNPAQMKRILDINTDDIVVSTRNINYNVATIIEAIPLVLNKLPDVKFIFIWPNEGKDEVPIIERIEKLGISKSVRIIGYLTNHNDLPKYLSIAKTFVSISKVDCFPQTALEAMAIGIFPVMSDIPPILSYMKGGIEGILVDPLSAESVAGGIVASLNLSEEQRRTAVENNHRFIIDKADFNKEMRKMEKLYYSLLLKKP